MGDILQKLVGLRQRPQLGAFRLGQKLRRHSIIRRAFYTGIVILAFGLGVSVTRIIANERALPSASGDDASHSAAASSNHASAPSATNARPGQQVGNGDTARSSTAAPAPSPACNILTAAIVSQAAGTDALPANGTDTKSADMETATCSYKNASVQQASLSVHIARTGLGKSENDLAFGSERPDGVRDVSGYGQAAFWNQSTGELNILSQNNWYILSRQSGPAASLQGAEALARQLTLEVK